MHKMHLCFSRHFFNQSTKKPFPVFFSAQVDSTQDRLKNILKQSPENALTFFSDLQTKGRGRQKGVWKSFPGKQLFMSTAIAVRFESKDLAKLSLVIGLIVRDLLEKEYAIKAKIKWPNDLYVNDKKISGILCETQTLDQQLFCVLGLGINIQSSLASETKEAFSPVFMDQLTDKSMCVWKLLGQILNAIHHRLGSIEHEFLNLKQNYNQHDFLKHKTVSVLQGDMLIKGKANGIQNDGALIILNREKAHSVYSGHISKIE